MTRIASLLQKIHKKENKTVFSEGIGGDNTQTITIRYGNDDTRRSINRLLATISYLGSAGCSREIRHAVDGDGAYSLSIKGLDKVETPDTDSDIIIIPGID